MNEISLRQEPYQRATRTLTEHYITPTPSILNVHQKHVYHHPRTLMELESLLQRSIGFLYVYAPRNENDKQDTIRTMDKYNILHQLVIITESVLLQKFDITESPVLFKIFKNLSVARYQYPDITRIITTKAHRRSIYGIHYINN
jgi:hypothetical protein